MVWRAPLLLALLMSVAVDPALASAFEAGHVAVDPALASAFRQDTGTTYHRAVALWMPLRMTLPSSSQTSQR